VDYIERDSQERAFLKALFSDTYLVDCLGRRRKSWKFKSLVALSTVFDYIPLFRHTVQCVELDYTDEEDNYYPIPDLSLGETSHLLSALELLSHCHNLKELKLQYNGSIDFTAVARTCPSLENFEMYGGYDGYHGHLHLSKLKSVVFWFNVNHYIYSVDDFLPSLAGSTHSLTSLTINTVRPLEDAQSLAMFTNLTHLSVKPMSPCVCDFITRATIRLHTLDIEVSSIPIMIFPIAPLLSTLSAPCLRNLQNLLHIPPWTYSLRENRLIFDTITSTLRSLQTLELYVILDIGRCHRFSSLTKLESLCIRAFRWQLYATPSRLIEAEEMGFFLEDVAAHVGPAADKAHNARIERALQAAFSRFVKKPKISLLW
jgi:hypothetical protein